MSDRTQFRTEYDDAGPLPPGLLIQLTFLAGPLQGKVEKLYKRNTYLGRSEGDIVLKDNAASKKHALIGFEGGRVFVRDLDSTNGTLLNGGRVWEAFVNSLDEITIGETVIKVEIKQVSASASWANLGMEETPTAGEPASGEITVVPTDRDSTDPLGKPLPKGVKGGLQVSSGLDAGLRHVIKKRGTVIGRVGADFELHDLSVSRKHASIEFMSEDRVILKDLRSGNGTFLNDRWTSVANLGNGDVIKVGNTVITFYLSVKTQS